jgi:hypothetical protein
MIKNSMKESVQPDYESFELYDFPHKPPKGYRYATLQFKRDVVSIWTVHQHGFVYNGHTESYCIWGFYNTKEQQYYAPINSSKIGNKVDVNDTTPYTAMPLNLNPLMQCLMSPN